MTGNGSRTAQHVSFVLLAEFDIDQGSILSHEYPYPTGMDGQLLADLMIPDGVHEQTEDWTIFYLNQTPGNTIASIFTPGDDDEEAEDKKDLLYVLNLVRTKHDKSVKRGAIVKALAICTHHPCIQIFKPILLIALEDYYADPSVECLIRLFDAVNAMDISLAPTLSRDEKLVLRVSERKDLFAEKFASHKSLGSGHQRNTSVGSNMIPLTGASETRKLSSSQGMYPSGQSASGHQRSGSSSAMRQLQNSSPRHSLNTGLSDEDGHRSSTEGSAIWVGEHDSVDGMPNSAKTELAADVRSSDSGHSQRPEYRLRKSSTDQLSVTSSLGQIREEDPLPVNGRRLSSQPHNPRSPVRDTHFFETSVLYNGHNIPVKLPVSTFPEEIGDYSLIQLIQTFTSPTATISGPLHPHLHTNGLQTAPLMLLFNALITQKRIIFLGYGRPAGHVSNFVLAACALGSGCGCHLRGFAERAFPYTNLSNKAVVEAVPGYIAGVKNPIFESLPMWDVLCHTDTGKIVVHRDISSVPPPISSFPSPPSLNVRGGAVVSLGDEESKMTTSMMIGSGGAIGLNGSAAKAEPGSKSDNNNYDSMFVEDLTAAVTQHFGEMMIRARVAEYVSRFIRIAACYEEAAFGSTSIGFPTQPFSETGVSTGVPQGFGGTLGAGMVFGDEVSSSREMAWNASRVEGWRLTRSYEYLQQDFQAWMETRPIKKMDIRHQISRLRYAKSVSDGEMDLIMHTMYEDVRTYEQIVELLSHLPPHAGGLLPMTFGLFHSLAPIRDATVDLLNIIRSQPIGNQFVSSLNAFHRFAFIQILDNRKREQQAQARQQEQISSQHHQQAQIAQQLFAAATTVADQGPYGTKPPSSASGSMKSRRETATGFVSQLFSGATGGGAPSNGGSLSVSRSGSMHRVTPGSSAGGTTF